MVIGNLVIGNQGEIAGRVPPNIATPRDGQQVPVVRASHKRLYRQAFGSFCMAFGLIAYVLGQVSAPLTAFCPSLKWLPLVVASVAAFWQGLQHIAAALHIQIVSFNDPVPPASATAPTAPETPTGAEPESNADAANPAA